MSQPIPSDAGCGSYDPTPGACEPDFAPEDDWFPSRSVVIPVFNGAATIGDVVEEILSTPPGKSLEIVLVNDGSADHSEHVCRALAERFPARITFVQLRHNRGEQRAVLAGLRYCRGQFAAVVDDDGQHPASEMVRLFERAESGNCDVVFGHYLRRCHPWHRRLISRVHERTARWLFGKPRGLRLSSFKVMNRFVVDRLCDFEGPFVNIDAILLRLAPRCGSIDVLHRKRLAGRSGYSYQKLFGVWLEALLGFSAWPYRAAMVVGACTACLAGGVTLAGIAVGLVHGEFPLLIGAPLILVLLGSILFCLGILGKSIFHWIGRSGQPAAVRYVFRASSGVRSEFS